MGTIFEVNFLEIQWKSEKIELSGKNTGKFFDLEF
jgi:hypothetical protein